MKTGKKSQIQTNITSFLSYSEPIFENRDENKRKEMWISGRGQERITRRGE